MKKWKALFLSLALSLTFATALTAVACGGDDEDGSSSSASVESTVDFGEEDSPVSIRFAQGKVNVNQYETVALALSVKGTSKEVTFTSSDETVASVDENGVVLAKDKVGSATISATVEGITATCVVNVVKTSFVPEIVCSQREYTIEDGDVLTFSVATEWNKETLDEDIAYAVTFAEDSLDAKAELSVKGNEITVKSKGVESIDVIVSATVRGIYTSKSFTVDVIASALKIQPTSHVFQPMGNAYKVSVATTTEVASDLANRVALDFVVAKGSQLFEDAQINWTINNAQLAKIEGKAIVGQKRGTVELTGSATQGGETAKVKVVCEVVPPEVKLEETAIFDLNTLTMYTVQSSLLGTLQDAEFHGEKVTTRAQGRRLAFDKTLFPKKASLLGDQQLVINTDVVRYIMDVEVYTMIIKTADDLKAMREISATDDTEYSIRFKEEKNSQYYDGYYILGNDIAFNDVIESLTNTGAVWGVQGNEDDNTRGFKGIFDGRGYTIDGLESCSNKYNETQSGGIFGYLAREGVVRNVTFTNAVLRNLNGFICAYGDGLIENVVVSYKKIGGNVMTTGLGTGNDYRAMATFFSRGAGFNATIKNCIVDASMAELNYATATTPAGVEECDLNLMGKAINVIDSYVLCPDATVMQYSTGGTELSGFAELAQKYVVFDDYDETLWKFVEGAPMLSGLANAYAENVPAISFVDAKDTLIAGFKMYVRLDNPYVEIEVSDVAGVEYANGILTATEEAKGQQVTVTAKSLIDGGVQATHVVTIDYLGEVVDVPTGEVKKVLHSNPVVTIGDNTWLGTENYAYVGDKLIGSGADALKINLDAYGWDNWGEANVTVVTVKEGVKSRFDVTLDIAYDETIQESADTVADTAFGNKWFVTTAETSDENAPEGFASVAQYTANTERWSNGGTLGQQSFNAVDLSAYREVWFAFKFVNATLQINWGNKETADYSDWVYFHLLQTADGVWKMEMTHDGKTTTYAHQTGADIAGSDNNYTYVANSLNALLYGGFYGTPSVVDGTGMRIYGIADTTPVVYSTEILGVLKD